MGSRHALDYRWCLGNYVAKEGFHVVAQAALLSRDVEVAAGNFSLLSEAERRVRLVAAETVGVRFGVAERQRPCGTIV